MDSGRWSTSSRSSLAWQQTPPWHPSQPSHPSRLSRGQQLGRVSEVVPEALPSAAGCSGGMTHGRHLKLKAEMHDGNDGSLHRQLLVAASPQRRRHSVCMATHKDRKFSVDSTATRESNSTRDALGLKLDENLFAHFWPLLDDCRDYARLSGCRFRSRSWDGLATGDTSKRRRTCRSARDNTAAAKARAEAAPTVYRFAERLRAGDMQLVGELHRASRIVSAEGVRSAMIATCQRLEMWPPRPDVALEVSDSDCNFDDVSAPLPFIAQHLYNDERRRQCLRPDKDDPDPMRRQAMMAIFITEFAVAVGVELPDVPAKYDVLLTNFNLKALAWEDLWDVPGQDGIGSECVNEVPALHTDQDSAVTRTSKALSAIIDASRRILRPLPVYVK